MQPFLLTVLRRTWCFPEEAAFCPAGTAVHADRCLLHLPLPHQHWVTDQAWFLWYHLCLGSCPNPLDAARCRRMGGNPGSLAGFDWQDTCPAHSVPWITFLFLVGGQNLNEIPGCSSSHILVTLEVGPVQFPNLPTACSTIHGTLTCRL